MPRLTDDGEYEYELKRKNDEPRSKSWLKVIQPTPIIVALIALFGVIFTAVYRVPTGNPNESEILLVVIINALRGSDATSQQTPTPNVVETLVAQTLTAISPTQSVVEPTARIVTATVDPRITDTPEIIVVTSTLASIATTTAGFSAPTQPIPSNQTLGNDLDEIFGAGNWFCFPHTPLEVAYRDATASIVVAPPIQYVEYWNNRYTSGQSVPLPGGGTVKLLYPIARSECPESQQQALTLWTSDNRSITNDLINEQLGVGNWACSSSTSIMIIRSIPQLTLGYPFNSLDVNYVKYGVGDTISNVTNGTAWGFLGSVCR